MVKVLLKIITGVLTSFMFFPFEFVAFPGMNTKKAMAALGLVFCAFQFLKRRSMEIPSNLFHLSIGAGVVSLIGVFAVTYNDTPDYAYATYIVSMWVWLSAAFVVCSVIKWVHGKIDVELVVHYLLVVSVVQCVLAIAIDVDPVLKGWVNTYIAQEQDFLNEVKRLYGIGAALDVAGTRFSACLIMLAVLIHQKKDELSKNQLWLYILAYVIIAVIGNMIARTTSVGIVLGLLYLAYVFKVWQLLIRKSSVGIWLNIIVAIILAVPIVSYLYSNNDQFQRLFRFAFEGFFNYVEHGTWETASTEKLKTMYVFPEEFKTWVIGDGYFSNPNFSDINYVGNTSKRGYYMGTDVGYLRFIFYFGTIGLLAFCAFMNYAANLCARNLPHYKVLFSMLLISNFVIWLKVSTDIFLVFALFICVANMYEEDEDRLLHSRDV